MRNIVVALVLCVSACATSSPTPTIDTPAITQFNESSFCDEIPPQYDIAACRLRVDDIHEAEARAALGQQDIFIERAGDVLTLIARAPGDRANLCCSLQGPLARIGESDLWAARFRLQSLDEAFLQVVPPLWFAEQRQFRAENILVWRGPRAPAAPAEVGALRGQRFERTLWSEALGETRRIFVYLPPGHDPARTYPTIFMADGAAVMTYATMIEALIESGAIPPVIMVGAGSGQESIVEDRSSLGIADLRSADYLPGFTGGGDRFEQHLRFFSEELVGHAVREYGASDDPRLRAVSGFSNGGSFSLFAVLRRPDVFANAFCLSPGWRRLSESDFTSTHSGRFFISTGLYEVRRGRSARAYADDLRAHGYDVAFDAPATGHSRDQELLMLSRYAVAAFGSR